MKIKYLFLFFLTQNVMGMNFVTVADNEYYGQAINLIATLHLHNFFCTAAIVVFDIGLKVEQREFLNSLAKVTVYDVEKKNPYMFDHFVVRRYGKEAGRTARGWYSWKPVVLKQASDLFDHFIFIDAGISVVRSMSDLYDYLLQEGYFFMSCNHSIQQMTTKPVMQKLDLINLEHLWILSSCGISSGFQGITKKLYDSYILPMYHLADDIAYFEDDGSCTKGFGWARPDQSISSIFIRYLNLFIFSWQGSRVPLAGKEVYINPVSYISFTRDNIDVGFSQQFLRFKQFVSMAGSPVVVNKRKELRSICQNSSMNRLYKKNKSSEKLTTLLDIYATDGL